MHEWQSKTKLQTSWIMSLTIELLLDSIWLFCLKSHKDSLRMSQRHIMNVRLLSLQSQPTVIAHKVTLHVRVSHCHSSSLSSAHQRCKLVQCCETQPLKRWRTFSCVVLVNPLVKITAFWSWVLIFLILTSALWCNKIHSRVSFWSIEFPPKHRSYRHIPVYR